MHNNISYTRSSKATALWFFEILLGAAGVFLTFSFFVDYFSTLEFLGGAVLNTYLGSFGGQASVYRAAQYLMLLFSVLFLFVMIMDGISATFVRFARVGMTFVRVVHLIAAICTLGLSIFFLVVVIYMGFNYSNMFGIVMNALGPNTGVLFILSWSALGLFFLMTFFYHLGVFHAMKTMQDNLSGRFGEHYRMKKTALSGISVTYGVFLVLAILALIFMQVWNINRDPSAIYVIVFLSLMAIKQFCVAESYSEMKRFNTPAPQPAAPFQPQPILYQQVNLTSQPSAIHSASVSELQQPEIHVTIDKE